MTTKQRNTLITVLEECFWEDYAIKPEEAESKLNSGDRDFERFLFRRIISDSLFPSNRLNTLFAHDKLKELFSSINFTGRAADRAALARAVLFNEVWEKEPQWIR